MINAPKTREDAEKLRYCQWAGNPKGYVFDQNRCAYAVHDEITGLSRQCYREPNHGPDGLYCKRHAKMIGGLNDDQS